MINTFSAKNIEELSDVAKQILKYTLPYKKFLFFGEMGVGKTTLIKALSLHLGVQDVVSSPTFSIVNEYITQKKEKIYHFDFYRIKDESEAFDLGYEEYFFSSSFCFIEWPEKVPNLVEDNMVKIFMHIEKEKRVIEVKI
ncbi:tRNA (adenosine(37)-N6)-threonylcarbamoyltransferase complex ATPase subunit type 1 TsaE [Flavobacteriales bacterium]|nr:tRNA (adenosine(37)-N6)-threonylcarbamoyltransferase complex ATPase subunit type 1 TsaE [Flavobacteriales bacterium]